MNYREKGNKAFVYGGFETARQEYTKGIEVTPEEPRLWSTMRKSSLNLERSRGIGEVQWIRYSSKCVGEAISNC
ncbi:hypothetical protein GLOIN_2v1790845 [Rhizophagus irregularis DAOM 181602=DAOM 197198]|nr:hypothetical protein GLOIN_2v1790845 [Rhizophagus irregularis DAOM 181602=DAOM 197198]